MAANASTGVKKDLGMVAGGVLLLGGGGFIGQAILARLNMTKRKVYVLGRGCDHTLEDVLPRCDTVVHLASTTTPGASEHHPIRELDNLKATLELLELLQQYPQIHLIFLSSGGALYGGATHLPVTETETIAPLSYHGAGKAAIELFLNVLRRRINTTILRPSNVYGPDQPLREGFGLIRHILEHAYNHTTLTVWGDGENVRDFIFVDDLVDICEQFIDNHDDGNTYHVGSGCGYSLNDIIKIVEKVIGENVKIEYKPARQADVKSVVLNISSLNKKLNWYPQVNIEEGIRRTWKWMQNR